MNLDFAVTTAGLVVGRFPLMPTTLGSTSTLLRTRESGLKPVDRRDSLRRGRPSAPHERDCAGMREEPPARKTVLQ